MKLEDRVQKAVDSFAKTLGGLAEDPYLKTAVMQFAIRELAWKFVDKEGLDIFEEDVAEQLEGMARIIREKAREAPNAS